MRKRIVVAALGLCALSLSSVAQSGVYTDKLSECLIESTSERDKRDMMVWMYASLSRNPAIAAYSTFTAADRARISQKMAKMMERLATESCPHELLAVVEHESEAAVEIAFESLGGAAAAQLMMNPEVEEGLTEYEQYFDEARVARSLLETMLQAQSK